MRTYAFADSSGILKRDRFFGTGLLVVKNVGDLGDKLCKNSQKPREILRLAKSDQVAALVAAGRSDEAIRMLSGSYRFEMKFDTVGNKKILPYYERMIDIFLADPDNRFSAMVIDKQNGSFDHTAMGDSWETYTKYVAMLTVREMRNMPGNEICLVVDEISRPNTQPLSLEDTIMSKIRQEASKYSEIDFEKVFGAFSIESHSSFPMQLCDILMGSVMYDYKKREGLNTVKTEAKKEVFVSKLRSALGVTTLANEFTEASKAYFSVFEGV